MKTIDFNFDNLGGIARLYAIPVASFRRLDRHPATGLARLSLMSAAEVIELPVLGDVIYSENQTHDDDGDRFEVQVGGFIPRQSDPLLTRQLERGEWLVVHQDCNGDILLSGTPDIPLCFSSGKTTGSPTERNGNNFSFAATQAAPSVHIDRRAFYI